MIEKNKLLEQLDEAIEKESTSSEVRELLKESKKELVKANSKERYTEIVLKIINIFGTFAKFFIDSA